MSASGPASHNSGVVHLRRFPSAVVAKKRSPKESLKAWRAAEDRYRGAAEPYFPDGDGQLPKLTKDQAVALSKARARADRHIQQCFKSLLS